MLGPMSPPADPPAPAPLVGPSGVPGAPHVPDALDAPAPARWTDRLNVVLLLAAACVLVATATPPVLRAAGVGAQASPVLRAEKLPRPDAPEPRPAREPAFQFDFGDDDDRPSPHGVAPQPRADRGADGDPLADDADTIRMGLARRDFRLHGDPSQDAPVLGEVQAGSSLMVMKEAGDWVLVVRSSAEGILMGWARRSEIAVR